MDFGSYEMWDLFNTSENESKRDEYKDVASKLESYLETINGYIRAADNEFTTFNNVHIYNQDFSGEIADGFYNKSSKCENELRDYINRLKAVRDLINNNKVKCEGLYNNYGNACDEEDRNGKAEWEERKKNESKTRQ